MAILCLCCGDAMAITHTKTDKPYLSCDECHVQLFVKGRAGVKRFIDKYGTAWQGGTATAAEAPAAPKPAPAAKPTAPKVAPKPKAEAPAPAAKPDTAASAPAPKKRGGFFD